MTVIPSDAVAPAALPSPAPAFAERAVQILNDGCLAMMISIGHQTRLFDLMATLPPATSEEIARQGKLSERYVREWLGGMVVGGVVRYDAAQRTYFLPPEHAAMLTRSAGADNLAAIMQFVALMGQVEQDVVEAFHHGKGVPYSAFPRFQQIQAEESRNTYDAILIDKVIPLDAALLERLRGGIDVADIGTGSGYTANLMARAFPSSRFNGFDLSTDGPAMGRARAEELGLTNITFETRDIATLEGQYDLVTAFDVIHDLAHPRLVLRRVAEALRPGGVFLMVDIAASSKLEENLTHPLAPALFTFSTMHCMSVSLAQGGEGLGTVWGNEKALELLAEAGFSEVQVHSLEGDILHSFFFARK